MLRTGRPITSLDRGTSSTLGAVGERSRARWRGVVAGVAGLAVVASLLGAVPVAAQAAEVPGTVSHFPLNAASQRADVLHPAESLVGMRGRSRPRMSSWVSVPITIMWRGTLRSRRR